MDMNYYLIASLLSARKFDTVHKLVPSIFAALNRLELRKLLLVRRDPGILFFQRSSLGGLGLGEKMALRFGTQNNGQKSFKIAFFFPSSLLRRKGTAWEAAARVRLLYWQFRLYFNFHNSFSGSLEHILPAIAAIHILVWIQFKCQCKWCLCRNSYKST